MLDPTVKVKLEWIQLIDQFGVKKASEELFSLDANLNRFKLKEYIMVNFCYKLLPPFLNIRSL